MTCHCCRQVRPFLLFDRWCVGCWRSHTMRQLDLASQQHFHGYHRSLAADRARGAPPTPCTIVAGPDGKARTNGDRLPRRFADPQPRQ